MFVYVRKTVVTIVALQVLVQMLLELTEFVYMAFPFLPLLRIRDIEQVLKKKFNALSNFISNFHHVLLHDPNPLKFALLYLENA